MDGYQRIVERSTGQLVKLVNHLHRVVIAEIVRHGELGTVGAQLCVERSPGACHACIGLRHGT